MAELSLGQRYPVSGQTIWLLDDFSEENGGTGIMPYSHMKGQRPPAEMIDKWHPDGEILTGVRGSVMVYQRRHLAYRPPQ